MVVRANGRAGRSARGPRLIGALLACAAAGIASPALAGAATRFADPSSTAASGSCAQSAPCSLQWAVSGAASGDDVTVAPGSYTLDKPLHADQPITLHGAAGQPAPQIVAGASVGGSFAVGLKAGSTVSHLAISTSVAHQAALDLASASADDLVLSAHGVASNGQAALMIATPPAPAAPTIVRDTVVSADGTALDAIELQHAVAGTALRLSASAPSTAAERAELLNVTAIASGAGADAIQASSDAGPVSLIDVVARGAAQDVQAPVGTVDMSYSDVRSTASSGIADQGNNITADPLFANAAAGDFHEAATSPTVDAGVLTGDSGSVDPDGNPRTLGNAPDIGAYELSPVSSPLGGDGGQPTPGSSGEPTPGSSDQPTSGSNDGSTPAPLGSLLSPSEGVPTLTNAAGAPLQVPVAGHSVDVAPAQGRVLVRVAGSPSFTPLSAGAQLPVGSVVDATAGAVELISTRDFAGTLQAGRFWGGRFAISQHGATRLITQLSLTGDLSGCRGPARAAAAARVRPRSRLLWGSDNHGQFSTRGRNAVATVRGTVWMMSDRCGGTLTKVLAGRVAVRNLRTGRSFVVAAGHQRLVRAPH